MLTLRDQAVLWATEKMILEGMQAVVDRTVGRSWRPALQAVVATLREVHQEAPGLLIEAVEEELLHQEEGEGGPDA